MSDTQVVAAVGLNPEKKGRDVGFAFGIVIILTILFLPIPPFLIDVGLSLSIALSILILMVGPVDPEAARILVLPDDPADRHHAAPCRSISPQRRMILSQGHKGLDAAGNIINGFSQFVMSGDFVIGLIVFTILVIVNFLVITKGATRIAEVGARFTLDAIPGKQMAIDADLNAGLIDDKAAQARRSELEEESSFFGAMDGASKFVRGDAIAGLIITAVNIFGGIVIGATRHGMTLGEASDVFTKLSVGDGLVSQIPALIVSHAAGLLVSKGGTRGSTDKAVMGQLGKYPRALFVAASLLVILAIMPGLPVLPFAILAGIMAFTGYSIPRRLAEEEANKARTAMVAARKKEDQERLNAKPNLKTPEIELCIGKQLTAQILTSRDDLANRVAKMRRKFAEDYGFVVPDIHLTDSLALPPKSYQIKIHGTVIASHELRVGELLVLAGPEKNRWAARRADPRTRLRHARHLGSDHLSERSGSHRPQLR